MLAFVTCIILSVASATALLVLRRLTQLVGGSKAHHDGVPRPPLVPDWWPFLGNALNMATGDPFWVKVEKKHGPAFRLLAMGETRTFVTTPALIQHIYKGSKSFDFLYFRMHYQSVVFGMSRSFSFSPVWKDHLFAAHHKAMQPNMLEGSTRKYVKLLAETFDARLSELGPGGKQVDLIDYVYDIIYTASSKALFSRSFPSAATKKPFLAFDQFFPLLTLKELPVLARKPAVAAREQLLDLLVEWWKTTTEEDQKGLAPQIMITWDTKESEGWTDRDFMALLLAELWALEANAPYAGLWTVVEILRKPHLIQTLRDEIGSATKQLEEPTLESLLAQGQAELVKLLPQLNACFQETLRFHTSSFSLRVVEEDSVIPAKLTGTPLGYSLKKGEQVICVTRKNQVDPTGDWGHDANVWDHERFLGQDRMKGSMMPFGGGVSMCEGRHFASIEILTFITSFLSTLDAEIVNDTLVHDTNRLGLGVIQPKGKMQVKLSRRGS